MSDRSLSSTHVGLRAAFPLIILTLACVLLTACGEPAEAQSEARQGPAQAGVPVTVEVLSTETVTLTSTLQGRTRAYRTSEIRPQVTGLIEDRLFEEGDNVKAGDPLYAIESSEYRAEVASAAAAYERSRATALVAEQNAKRFASLAEIEAISTQQKDEADAAVAQSRADVSMAKAALERARIDLERAVVRAPIDGTIGRSVVTQGALVTANQSAALATITQLDPLYVDLTASAEDVMRWRRQLQSEAQSSGSGAVPVTLSGKEGQPLSEKGRLEFSEVSVDEEAGTVILRAIVPNPDRLLLPGLFVRATLPTAILEDVMAVPQQAVLRTPRGEPYVFVVNEEGMAEQRPVTIVQAQDGQWILSEGVKAGDRLITDGFQRVQPGAPVRVTNPPADRNSGTRAAAGASTGAAAH
ncbi:Secretion protein HlyD [Parvularcula bermudensis HTCC2503]|uniref:Secretion protein HlyD n=1 Tax=Parvularcula bermudensis (strain ATCC BAA-594 / HTCC2503 / KCTC 12087) TaxID=314260 RepID=E0TCY5_PARBH|nr:efflux RND transporter periplasmic adaptor subunit [Parvularcula bermudensis]ADM10368.1 Secretion protein HlyD [Parvularcula bermudensis HTCC2503]